MKIALVTSEFVHNKDGGLATYTYRLAQYLIQLGHEPIVITTDSTHSITEYNGIELHFVTIDYSLLKTKKSFFRKTKPASLYAIFNVRSQQINDYVSKLNVDIVQYPHLGGLGIHRVNNLPSVIRLSSSTRLCFEQGGYGETKSQMEDQEKAEFEAITNVDAVFGPSKMIANITEKETGINVRVIETPFQNQKISKDFTISESLKNKKYVLYFGSLIKLKGVEIICKILENFLKQNPDYHFVFVGKSMKRKDQMEMSEFIKQSAGDLVNRVTLTGSLSQSQLSPIIDNAELITLPSLIDNFPNSCIESMAAGKIVVGTNGNGFDQLIEDGRSGYLCDSGNANQLLEKIEKAIALSPEERILIGDNAKKRIELLSPDIVVNELIEFYRETIANFELCAE